MTIKEKFLQDYKITYPKAYNRTAEEDFTRELEGPRERNLLGGYEKKVTGDQIIDRKGKLTQTLVGDSTKYYNSVYNSSFTGNATENFNGSHTEIIAGASSAIKAGACFKILAGMRTRIVSFFELIASVSERINITLSETALIVRRNRFMVVRGETAIFNHEANLKVYRGWGAQKHVAILSKKIIGINIKLTKIKKDVGQISEKHISIGTQAGESIKSIYHTDIKKFMAQRLEARNRRKRQAKVAPQFHRDKFSMPRKMKPWAPEPKTSAHIGARVTPATIKFRERQALRRKEMKIPEEPEPKNELGQTATWKLEGGFYVLS